MFTVLFSDTSYNRLDLRLFSYPPLKPGGEPPLRPRGEGSKKEGLRNPTTPEEQKYPLETEYIVDLSVAINKAILCTELLRNLEEANAYDFTRWKESLTEVNKKADEFKQFLKGLEDRSLPDSLRERVEDLLTKARHLSRILPNNLPKIVQNILDSRTDLKQNSELTILPRLIKEIPGKLGTVSGLLSRKLPNKEIKNLLVRILGNIIKRFIKR
jgi:hypothetical protein